ncbi:MAG: sigma-70 family RNA polymerase sigma factor, partial [Clostridia bacterium]|nr:sigma-70 family RNA polymerase sigma factor [Clostridia bacterium]
IDEQLIIKKLYDFIEELKDEREKTIIIMRYGLYDTQSFTQNQIAKKLNISRSYVSRIEKKVIEKLRKKLLS